MDEKRMALIEKIGNSDAAHPRALQKMKFPKYRSFPQFTLSELSRGKPVLLDSENRKERVEAGAQYWSLPPTHCLLTYTNQGKSR